MIFISLKRLQTTATIHKANKKFKASHLCGLLFYIDNYKNNETRSSLKKSYTSKNVWYNINTTFLTIIFYDIDNLKKHVWIFGFMNILFCRVE